MMGSAQDPEKIAAVTLDHYNRHAEDFREGTRDHDVSQNIEALLQAIEGEPPFAILDFGCGPGRDLKAFAELGHVAVGLEGAARLADELTASGVLPPVPLHPVDANASWARPGTRLVDGIEELAAILHPDTT